MAGGVEFEFKITRFVMKKATVGAMLKGNGFSTKELLMAKGQAMANAAGEGFEAKAGQTATRARVGVLPVTPDAQRREAEQHVLASVIGAAG